jgi:hypothetical protein
VLGAIARVDWSQIETRLSGRNGRAPVAARTASSYAARTSICALRGASIVAAGQIADMNGTIESAGSEKDRPLWDDIRLLGRILGDTVREQEGEAIFDIVEHIRQTSIRFHRDNDEAARHALEVILNDLSPRAHALHRPAAAFCSGASRRRTVSTR